MAATASAAVTGTVSRPRTGFDRRALALVMPIGPLAIAIVRGILPYDTTSTNTPLAARIGVSPAATGRLLDSIGAIQAIGLASDLFVIGHILGLILLGVALWRGRAVPAWAALAIALSQVLHFVFAVIEPVHVLDGLAWGLTAVGFAAAALALVRD
jgi:hypothetical protein